MNYFGIAFHPSAFADNVGYLGVGMFGVFLVIGVTVGAVMLLGHFDK